MAMSIPYTADRAPRMASTTTWASCAVLKSPGGTTQSHNVASASRSSPVWDLAS